MVPMRSPLTRARELLRSGVLPDGRENRPRAGIRPWAPRPPDSRAPEVRGTMEILSRQATTKGPAEMFTGDVWFDVIAKGEPPSRLRVNTVRFAPGARTAWHSHAVGQTLYVTEGLGLARSRGGTIV